MGDFPDASASMNNEITPEYGDPGCWRGPNTLKYRVVTVSRPYKRVNIWQYCSPINFWRPYGESGFGRMSSRLGRTGASPYTADDPAKTRRLTPPSRAAINRFCLLYTSD